MLLRGAPPNGEMFEKTVLLLSLVIYSRGMLPKFSWDTVPVFFHSSNQTGDYTSDALNVIAKYQMVTVEKWQGYDVNTTDDEDAMVKFMIQVKKVNPEAATYFYMNSFKDRPEMTRMAREINENPEWFLKDSNGDKVKNSQGFYVFDLSQPEVRKWWSDTCLNAVAKSNGDGCFCDSSQRVEGQKFKPPISDRKLTEWGDGLLTLTKDVQNLLGNDKLLIGKVANQSYVKAIQIEFFSANNNSINELILGVANGKVVQAHVPVSVDCTGDLTNYMAAFLIGAGKYSYFGCGKWNSVNDDTKALTWRPEYDKPLGEPIGSATYSNNIWSREFAKGTKVEFDVSTNKGTITWGTKF